MTGQDGNWPTFELVTFSPEQARGLLQDDCALFTTGVPRGMFGGFSAAERLEIIEHDEGTYIKFGHAGHSHDICLDPRTGRVVEILKYGDSQQLDPVNTSIGAFTECVRIAIERFPFFDPEDDEDRIERAVKDLQAAFEAVDSLSGATDSFWSTFVDDVHIGDYSAAEILHDSGRE